MIPYMIKYFPKEDIELFKKIEKMVHALPEVDLGKERDGKKILLSCHILTRAIGRIFKIAPCTGYVYPNYEHSWLTTEKGNVIDAYPPATIGGPVLVMGNHHYPARWHYEKCRISKVSQGSFSRSTFKRSVRRIESALRKVM